MIGEIRKLNVGLISGHKRNVLVEDWKKLNHKNIVKTLKFLVLFSLSEANVEG
jgi:hypothetical protein